MYGKRDWESLMLDLELMQNEQIQPSQDEIAEFNNKLSIPDAETHQLIRQAISKMATDQWISGDVEFEMLFVVGEEFNPDNGGWADNMQPFQKYAVWKLVTNAVHAVLQDSPEVYLVEIVELPFGLVPIELNMN